MGPIDWRELYAENRAVIEGGLAGHPARPLGPSGAEGGRPRGPAPVLGPHPGDVRARQASPGAGAWEELAGHEGDGRSCFVYTPPGLSPTTPVPLVVMLHGCTQTARSFAGVTRMNEAADRHAFVVLYPEQSRHHNGQACWNWFLDAHQARGSGEPAFIARAARRVMGTTTSWTIDARRVFVAGLSAGGAMAAIMGATHPELFTAIAVHSGLAYRSATSLDGAFGAMAQGGPDPEAQGRAARETMGRFARPVPTIVVHGTADRTVVPANGEDTVRQWMTANRLAASGGYEADVSRPSVTSRLRADGGLRYTWTEWHDRRGNPLQAYVEVEDLGHAWSGGSPDGSYTDPRGPSATELIWDFFARAAGARR